MVQINSGEWFHIEQTKDHSCVVIDLPSIPSDQIEVELRGETLRIFDGDNVIFSCKAGRGESEPKAIYQGGAVFVFFPKSPKRKPARWESSLPMKEEPLCNACA